MLKLMTVFFQQTTGAYASNECIFYGLNPDGPILELFALPVNCFR